MGKGFSKVFSRFLKSRHSGRGNPSPEELYNDLKHWIPVYTGMTLESVSRVFRSRHHSPIGEREDLRRVLPHLFQNVLKVLLPENREILRIQYLH